MHSPFVFNFITRMLRDKTRYPCYAEIEKERQKLLRDQTLLTIEDHGAGSASLTGNQRSVSRIARTSLKPAKYGQLLFRICRVYNVEHAIELGTSLGITSAYLANGAKQLNTIEGSPEIARVASGVWENLKLKNIHLHTGTFSEKLSGVLQSVKTPQLVFIDGDHRYASTLHYFNTILPYCTNDTILIFDDIHWSSDMEKAWEEIKNHHEVRLSINLFFIGLVFFKQEFKEKQHFSIIF